MPQLYYDLHLHSCLSPCGDDDATPASIAGIAALNGLDVIALTDHNTARNCPAFLEACSAYGIIGIPGMELTTAEDFHCVLLFDTLAQALAFDAYVDAHRMKIRNKPEIYGHQYVCDAEDRILSEIEHLLIPATEISFDDLSTLADSFGALMFPAHIDKSSTSILASLGQIPPDSRFTAAEVKDLRKLHQLKSSNPYLDRCHILSNSDAHQLADIREAGVNALSLFAPARSADAVLQALRTPPGTR